MSVFVVKSYPVNDPTLRKKGTKTVPLGYYRYKWYSFLKGALFFLNNPVYDTTQAIMDLLYEAAHITDSQIVLTGVLFQFPFFF